LIDEETARYFQQQLGIRPQRLYEQGLCYLKLILKTLNRMLEKEKNENWEKKRQIKECLGGIELLEDDLKQESKRRLG
jgi:hypothetical protein